MQLTGLATVAIVLGVLFGPYLYALFVRLRAEYSPPVIVWVGLIVAAAGLSMLTLRLLWRGLKEGRLP